MAKTFPKPEKIGGYLGYRGKPEGWRSKDTVWPPGFKSQTCCPFSEHSMLKRSEIQASLNSRKVRERMSDSGLFAGLGYLGQLLGRAQKVDGMMKSSDMWMRGIGRTA